MRATMILHNPPAANEEPSEATAVVNGLAEKIGKFLGADKVTVRSGAGWNFEIEFVGTKPISLKK